MIWQLPSGTVRQSLTATKAAEGLEMRMTGPPYTFDGVSS